MKRIPITNINNKTLHIGGFPDAVELIQLSGPKAQRLVDLSLHRSDLQFALESLEALDITGVSDHVRESLWRSAIIHFVKCFQKNASRSSLKITKIYKSAPPEAMMNFNFFENIRNKHLVHDENSYAQSLPAAALNDGTKDYKIEGILTSNVFVETLGKEQYSNLMVQVQRAITWVEREFDTLRAHLKQDLEMKSYEDLFAMQKLTVTVPKIEELNHPRKRI